jgi:hypothetical protein
MLLVGASTWLAVFVSLVMQSRFFFCMSDEVGVCVCVAGSGCGSWR